MRPYYSPDAESALLHRRRASREAHRPGQCEPCLSRCLGLLLSHSSLLCDHVSLDCPRTAGRFPPVWILVPHLIWILLSLAGCTRPASARQHRWRSIQNFALCCTQSVPDQISRQLPLKQPVMHHFLRRASCPRKARSSQCLRPLLRSPHASKTTLSTQRQLYARRPVLIGPC